MKEKKLKSNENEKNKKIKNENFTQSWKIWQKHAK